MGIAAAGGDVPGAGIFVSGGDCAFNGVFHHCRVVGVRRYAPAVVAATGKKDPGLIVADEVAGQAITMLVIALLAPENICNATVLGFALFRLFDIFKPWPCKRLEKLTSGVGILADDLMAGVYGGIVAAILIHYVPTCFR